MRPWPRSLVGRVAAILLAGLAIAYGLAYWAVMQERGRLVDSMMASYLGRDVVSSLAILDRLPAAERRGWLERLARPNYTWSLDEVRPTGVAAQAQTVAHGLDAWLGSGRVQASGISGQGLWLVSLRLQDGTPVGLHLRPPARGVTLETAVFLMAQLILVALCTGWAVRLATRPLKSLAAAAARLGQAPDDAKPLPEDGPVEVRQAAQAFNTMQRRIAEHTRERLQILAAVSHDLQSPITRMRVRAELLDDAQMRNRLLADLAEMQRLVEDGLAYARTAHASVEPLVQVDLHALLDALACDYADTGRPVRLTTERHNVILTTRPQALRRVVTNLVDNALKFGGRAEMRLSALAGRSGIAIRVLDDGPGIPPARLTEVLQPFRRIESSRNRETGGSGLGLAIAAQLSKALNAELSLRNRPEGGLEAILQLPGDSNARAD